MQTPVAHAIDKLKVEKTTETISSNIAYTARDHEFMHMIQNIFYNHLKYKYGLSKFRAVFCSLGTHGEGIVEGTYTGRTYIHLGLDEECKDKALLEETKVFARREIPMISRGLLLAAGQDPERAHDVRLVVEEERMATAMPFRPTDVLRAPHSMSVPKPFRWKKPIVNNTGKLSASTLFSPKSSLLTPATVRAVTSVIRKLPK